LYHYRARTYDPAQGRFKQRDSSVFDDGTNIYAYVEDRPAGRTDASGHWATADHETLTKRSLKDSTVRNWIVLEVAGAKLQKCYAHIERTLVSANQRVDSIFGHFWDYEWHYNRDFNVSPEKPVDVVSARQWDAKFGAHLDKLMNRFKSLVVGKTNVKRSQCNEALAIVGQLSHAWQDYYAHAIARTDRNERAEDLDAARVSLFKLFTVGGHGNPEGRGATWPSSYSVWGGADHPPFSEPLAIRGLEQEKAIRWDGSISFVRDKYTRWIGLEWLSACKCTCP
jgi:hypothetical protein